MIPLDETPMPGPWAARSRCRTVDTHVFFPGRGESTSDAKKVCRYCPVADACLEYALAAPPSLQGVWSGTTQADRAELRADRRRIDDQRARFRNGQTRPGELYAALEQLSHHPDRWARVARYRGRHSAQTTASLLRNGNRAAPPGRWRFEGRLNDLGGSDLYAIADTAAAPLEDTA